MSVLIKGVEIPKNCGDCPFCIFTADEKKHIGFCNTSDDDYYCKVLDRFMEYDEVDGGVDILGKPDDCPLVKVPTPHGELIDKQKLYEQTAKWERQGFIDISKAKIGTIKWISMNAAANERSAFKYDVADAPIVIEAEVEE